LLEGKRDGFFVEFGATNGRDLSNTLTLEEHFGWTGLLAGPASCWHAVLKANRKAAVDIRCVWTLIGGAARILGNRSVGIVAAQEPGGRGLPQERPCERQDLFCGDRHAQRSAQSAQCLEGSELAILQAFDFADYDIKIMIIEHNFVEPRRQEVFSLLSSRCGCSSHCRNSMIGMRNARYSTDEPPKVYARDVRRAPVDGERPLLA
jgi:hypothetical protein